MIRPLPERFLFFMFGRTPVWSVVVLVVLIVAVAAATMGMAWHCHHDPNSADQCTLCHLLIAPTVASPEVCQLVTAQAEYVVRSESYISRWVIQQIPSRAPPA